MDLKYLSSNWKKLQGTLKKEVPTSTKRKRSDREGQNDLLKKRKTDTDTKGKPPRTRITIKRKKMSEGAQDGGDDGGAKGASPKSSSGAPVSKVNEGRSPTAELGKYVAMDCEMVYDSYVRPKEMVTDWRTHVSGIAPRHMAEARSLEQVQKEVAEILDGRILVGHALRNDLDALLLSHPKRDIRDTSKHPPYRKVAGGGSPRLKVLASEFLGLDIQGGAHSSVEDAKATMLLYRRDKDEFEREHLKKWPVRVAPEDREKGGDEKKKKKKKKKTRKR